MIELIGIAFVPLTTAVFSNLPDRGYISAKVLGLLLTTWLVWIAGSLGSTGNLTTVSLGIIALFGLCGWILRGRCTVRNLRDAGSIIALEEGLFIASFVLWALLRSFHPNIAGTEKPMDLMYLQAAAHASSFPPQDLWLSGHSVNYYYFGYVAMALIGHLASTPPWISYNLALAFIFAAAITITYSILFNLTRSLKWASLGPVFVVLLGNDHSFFFQVIRGQFPWNQSSWYWESSRVVGESVPGAATTINEFPIFSLVLGDLHPHVLAIPFVMLAITGSLALLFPDPAANGRPSIRWLRLCVVGVSVGALAATNSWDYPTYLLLAAGAAVLFSIPLQRDEVRQDHPSEAGSPRAKTSGARPRSASLNVLDEAALDRSSRRHCREPDCIPAILPSLSLPN